MGTYHFLDGARVRIFYRGNEKTCGRCHEPARSCPGKGMARDCDSAGGPRVNLADHMRKLWGQIGFQPASFTLPTGDDTSDQNDKPIAEKSRFHRNENPKVFTEDVMEKFVGMTIANINLEVSDENVKKFISEYVSEEIDEKEIDVVRDQRKVTVTISKTLNANTIKEAMSKINFNDCKEKFFGRPLYCRPLRNITPEKVSSKDSGNISPTAKTGATPKIPGLVEESSENSSAKKAAKKERQKQRKAEELERKLKEERESQKLSIFDKMMKTDISRTFRKIPWIR